MLVEKRNQRGRRVKEAREGPRIGSVDLSAGPDACTRVGV